MNILPLIKKADEDCQLPVYPSLKELIPAKSVYQNNFFMQLSTVLASQKPNEHTKLLQQSLSKMQQSAVQSLKAIAKQGEEVKELNQRDAPKKLLAKIEQIENQLDEAKIGFFAKKNIKKALQSKKDKYLKFASLVNSADQLAKKLAEISTENISLEQVSQLKDKLKELSYYECLTGNIASKYSVMPELLNKKYLLKGDSYE